MKYLHFLLERGCLGKLPFDSKRDAKVGAKSNGASKVYKCPSCTKWHLSMRVSGKQRRR